MVGARDDQKVASLGAWNAHSQGLTTLLRLRGREQFSTSSGRNIFRLVHEIIVRLRSHTFSSHIDAPLSVLTFSIASTVLRGKCRISQRIARMV